MSLIRNGGFERGNTDFWGVESAGTLEVSTVLPKYGAYCGKFISGGNAMEKVLSNDYIEVMPYQIIDTAIWIKSATSRTVYPILYLYDVDYSYIDMIRGIGIAADTTYLLYTSQFIIPPSTAYIRFGCMIGNSAVNEEFYIDSASINILLPECCKSGMIILLPMTDYTTVGSFSSTKKDMKQFKTYYAELQCVFADDTTPTLDAAIYEKDDFNNDVLLGSFTQVTGKDEQRIDLPMAQGKEMSVGYTIGGTNPDIYFGISIIGKG